MTKLFLQALVAGFGLAIGFAVVWLIADPLITSRRVSAVRTAFTQPQAVPPVVQPSAPPPDAQAVAAGTQPAAPSRPAPPASGVAVPRTLEEQYGGDVQQMLDQADAWKQHGITSKEDIARNLVAPEGANAAALYRKVLAVEPNNVRARQGLQEIASFFASFARRECDRQLFAACKANAQSGLQADPDNAQLRQLEQQADDAVRAQGG